MEITRIPVRGTNCYLLQSRRGSVVIDPGPVGAVRRITDGAAAAGVNARDVKLILVTHGHLDHYGAASEVKNWCRAPIAAHPDAPSASRSRANALPPAQTLRGSAIRWLYLLAWPLFPFRPLQADLAIRDGDTLEDYGVDGRVVAVPGHSPESLAVVTADGDALVGDLLVNYTVPSQPLYMWDREAWRQSVRKVALLRPRTVYVGHGDPFSGDQMNRISPARYQLRWWVR